ncbi:MAG: 50S ribosomal protein L22, partial [archaeon]|nr:50S ribosomal protein L22 [archaeon]
YSTNVPISMKYSLEISRTIKGRMIGNALQLLDRVAEQQTPLPLHIYHKKVPHRKGNAMEGTKGGRYPVRASMAWLKLLGSVRHNADVKGLDRDKLKIIHATACIGFRRQSSQSQGRISGKNRKEKSTHIEIVVAEVKA